MFSREGNSALTGKISYASPTAIHGKDFDFGEERLTETVEDENAPLSSSFVGWHLSPLHEAAERGDDVTVFKLLLNGNVDVNEKAGGHRALRTALHRAAGYGHLGVVKQLIEAGADPEKHSSAHRTPLHEACTGGHTQVVKELLKHIADVDTVDSNGQTAAHLAAYHGEVDCLKELISSGCDVALVDKQGRTPAHLAAMKNHPALLRCLIENDTELNCGDDQGWTPAHFAAISGGLESLKVLALSDIGVTSRDSAGCVPAHYTAAHDHLPCLMFLVNTGLTKMDVRDRSGRSLLHLAAQHGATECLHWLLEYKGNPNIIDGSGATPVHLAALGAHVQCISCLIQHGANMEVQTASGDAPLDFAKRTGNPNCFQRAVKGEVPCRFCVSKRVQYEYELAHQPTAVEKNIIQQGSQIYITKDSSTDSVPRLQQSFSSHSAKRSGAKSKGPPQVLPKRDLASRYFGEHLFTLPVSVTGSKVTSVSSRAHRKR